VSADPRGEMERLSPPPFARLRERLLEESAALERAGNAASAAALSGLVDGWWAEQEAWVARVRDVLGVHHEINNALVGVRGNLQLVLKDPTAVGPHARERLEVVLRESGRIQEASARLRALKIVLGEPFPGSRAA